MARKRKSNNPPEIAAYSHAAKRTNIPPAKIAAEGVIPRVDAAEYDYSPHLAPILRFDPTARADQLRAAVDRAIRGEDLSADDIELLEAAANSAGEPWLEWAGKRPDQHAGQFSVAPTALHIHERISPGAVIRSALRKDVERTLFADPMQPYHEAVQFYRHSVDWANRLILGDSLEVMSSLAVREGMAAKVQMVYIDPPYAINYQSNFQPQVGMRAVHDKDADLTREVETVRAYRDTWSLGIHSYLSYMRRRLSVARELLADTGSIFVQISDTNLHYVRCLLDEVFGAKNFVSLITYRTKTMTLGSRPAEAIGDFLLWYAKDKPNQTVYNLFVEKHAEGDKAWSWVELESGERRRLSRDEVMDHGLLPEGARVFQPISMLPAQYRPNQDFNVEYQGKTRYPPRRSCWATDKMDRLLATDRVHPSGETLRYVLFFDDYPVARLSSMWMDTAGARNKRYPVQTSQAVVQRCMLMVTKPGDLVLDPTCGGGTTAWVAEKWGRRWITIDTSRMSIFAARHRLLVSGYEYYALQSEERGVDGGFRLRSVPHITRGAIGGNEALDGILERWRPQMDELLTACSVALETVDDGVRQALADKLSRKRRDEGARSITDADRRRWQLPTGNFQHWEIPFDTDSVWPQALTEAVLSYRNAWRLRRSEIDRCNEEGSSQEALVDEPEVSKGVLRVAGPFTVEGVRPEELTLGEDGRTRGSSGVSERSIDASQNAAAYLDRMIELLAKDGVTFSDGLHRSFARIEPITDARGGLHAEAHWTDADAESPSTVGIALGPEAGPVTAEMIEDLVRSARRYDELLVAAFSFDAAAQEVIQETTNPRLTIHMAHIRPDAAPGMEGLLKSTPKSQLFSVFGQPEIAVSRTGEAAHEFVVELLGVDVYSPLTGEVRSTGASKVAAWFLDSDYDGRCFCVAQAFFPDKSAWKSIKKALGKSADLDAFDALSGTRSIPFAAGSNQRIAVKVIDARGNEVMAVRTLHGGE